MMLPWVILAAMAFGVVATVLRLNKIKYECINIAFDSTAPFSRDAEANKAARKYGGRACFVHRMHEDEPQTDLIFVVKVWGFIPLWFRYRN